MPFSVVHQGMQDPRRLFETAIAREPNPERRDDLRLAMLYFTDPAFRRSLEDAVWQFNQERETPTPTDPAAEG